MEKESADAVPEVLKKLPNKKSSAHGEPARVGPVRIGRLSVGPGILGYGSCGTIVFEGELDGRPVAVKRLLAQFHELARRELATLISSDEHPNVLRCFAMEEDADFVYVALERCVSALASVVDGGSMGTGLDLANKEGRDAFDLVNPATRRPTPEGMTLMRDVCEGLHALHCRGIVHRDLKPQNVLVTPQRRGKLADMGLAKRLGVGARWQARRSRRTWRAWAVRTTAGITAAAPRAGRRPSGYSTGNRRGRWTRSRSGA